MSRTLRRTVLYWASDNMTAGAGRVIAWDAENRPLTITLSGITTTFAYDGDGRRVKKAEINGSLVTTTVYVGNHYELKTYSTSAALPWWNARWGQREVLTVTNQLTTTLATSYTLKVNLTGSQAGNIYGKSLASGNDLRVVYYDGKAWKELDRDLVAFSSSAIELRFKTQADIAGSGQSTAYYLYYGNFTAGKPPSDGKKVYYYFSDFSVNVLDWVAVSGTWGQSVITGAEGKLSWTYRQSDPNASATRDYLKDTSVSLTDFVYEGKIRIATDPSSGSHGASLLWRYVDTNNFYQVQLANAAGYSGIYKTVGGSTSAVNTGNFTYAASTWYTVGVSALGTAMTVTVNGTQKWAGTDSSVSGTKIGIKTWSADAYFDDVKVRKLVWAEPFIVLGAEATRPVADKYYYGGSQRIAMRSGGALTYIFSDHLGGTSVTLNATTGVTSTISYYPYGGSRFSTGALPTDRLFTGQINDSSTGLYDFGARYYDGYLNRWISPDSIVPQPGNPQDLNRFSYVRNNPLKYSDPTGHYSEDELKEYLGEDWNDAYFGAGGVFQGRDALHDMLVSDKTTDLNSLRLMSLMFKGVRANVDKTGLGMSDKVDAIGARISGSGGAAVYASLNTECLLNLASGEFSYFVSPGAGVMLGAETSASATLFLMQNLPNNRSYWGPFYNVGLVATIPIPQLLGSGPGITAGYTWAPGTGTVAKGYDVGAVYGIGEGAYVGATISLELQRLDKNGTHWAPPFENLLKWISLRVSGGSND